MNVLYIGGGFVGACSAAVSADSGHQTLVFDVDQKKVVKLGSGNREAIESCLFEEGLSDLLIRNHERIGFTSNYTDAEKFLDSCDAVFMCLPTPEIDETGESDLTYYRKAAEQLAKALAKRNGGSQSKYIVIVNKSTVPINMLDITETIMQSAGVVNYGVVSNPEFLVEGKAIEGSIHPDRVVVGAANSQDFEIMRQLYRRFYDAASIKYLEVNPAEAAAGKLLANFYLFNKLAVCFDVTGRVTETFPGIQFENIRRILTSDPRIGSWGLYDSLYAGGSCLVKDARSLKFQLAEAGANAALVAENYEANQRQLRHFLERAHDEAGFNWSGATVALLGLAFKQDTNDVRNSPSLDIAEFCNEQKVKSVHLFDPVAKDSFQSAYPAGPVLEYCVSEMEAIEGAQVVIIATDWPQFRSLGDWLLKQSNRPLLMDGRRMLQHYYPDLKKAGFAIVAVGSPFIKP